MSANAEQAAARARLCTALAEALAEPPAWLSESGHQWPLFISALEVAQHEDCTAIRQTLLDLAEIPPEDLRTRRRRYEALFFGGGRPRLWLYESLALDSQLAGPSTVAVGLVYEAAGLVVAETELPDHASVELAFLAHLFEQESKKPTEAAQWRRARRLFVRRHAGHWLPALGEALARTGDLVYRPIGCLLSAALGTDLQPRRSSLSRTTRGLPVLPQPENCNLCSFCVQVCPTRALAIHETEETTALLLADSTCVGCERCARVCMANALRLSPVTPREGQRVLRQSPRVRCPACGQFTVSQAELAEVAARIGTPTWLNYCSDCRPLLMERVP